MVAAPVSCRRRIQNFLKINDQTDDSANHSGNVCILSAGVPTVAHRQSSKNKRCVIGLVLIYLCVPHPPHRVPAHAKPVPKFRPWNQGRRARRFGQNIRDLDQRFCPRAKRLGCLFHQALRLSAEKIGTAIGSNSQTNRAHSLPALETSMKYRLHIIDQLGERELALGQWCRIGRSIALRSPAVVIGSVYGRK